MFVNKRVALSILVAVLMSTSSIAAADTWAEAPKEDSAAHSWTEMYCDPGSGWRPCQPKLTCLPFAEKYNSFAVAWNHLGNRTYILWVGGAVLAFIAPLPPQYVGTPLATIFPEGAIVSPLGYVSGAYMSQTPIGHGTAGTYYKVCFKN